ncbi:MAG: SRPBCC family protein [Bacteroidales bacterium]|jgi:uncharacterized membrane protein
MRFTCSTVINLPIDKVLTFFTNTQYLKHWQKGLVSHEILSGALWQQGTKSKIIFQNGKRRVELIETIQTNDLPNEIVALYEHEHMENTMTSRFSKIDEDKTVYIVEINYVKLFGFVPKLMFFLMPGFPKKQTQKMVDSFKAFAESQKSEILE